MPMLVTGPAARSPARIPRYSDRMSQCSVPPTRTGSLANRATGSSSSRPGSTRPAITRPLDAPRSTAANTPSVIRRSSSQESGRDAGVDRDVEAGGVRKFAAGEHEHRVGHVLGQHLALEQGPLGVVLAELLLGYAV